MPASDTTTLVSTQWLTEHLDDPNLRILDASWYLPNDPRDPNSEYTDGHIPGARFFDIDAISDSASDLPHMLPPPEKFVSKCRALGIGDGHQIVVYHGAGLFSAARVWWMFRLMGKFDVAVLDGGLPKWRAEGRKITADTGKQGDRHLTVAPDLSLVRSMSDVSQASQTGSHEILDARSNGRFTGSEADPRPGMQSGHIPGSKNVPYNTLLNPDGTLKSPEDTVGAFRDAGVDLSKPVITTCGSGITAAILFLALTRIGKTDLGLYDGSWSEWGRVGNPNIATGDV